MMCDSAFVQGGWNAHHHPREPKGIPPGPVSKLHGSAGYGWGGLGGSSIWFNPVENIGFGCKRVLHVNALLFLCRFFSFFFDPFAWLCADAVTGASAGLSGDEDRVGPLLVALQGTPCMAGATPPSKL
jgi:hypothetical protein|eukprot:COSAG06_NODE_5419_length_3495_cov_3.252650_6_plen_128_part_00